MGKMPKGWLDYTPLGQRLEGTRFISFKVPLMNMSLHEVAEDNRLDGPMLLERVPNLGMIIDLTDTSRYYNPNYFMSRGLHYRKLSVPGHVLPHPNLHKQFASIVDNYLQDNGDNDNLIGVHCTHGCNRTGLMICTYLVRNGIFPAAEALASFQKFRGHDIHRDNYIESILQTRRIDSEADSAADSAALTPSTPPVAALSWRQGVRLGDAQAEAPLPPPPSLAPKWPNAIPPAGGTLRDITPQSWRDRQAAAAATAAAKSAAPPPPLPATDLSAVPPPPWLDRSPATTDAADAANGGGHDPLRLRWQTSASNRLLAQLTVRPEDLIPDGQGGYYIRVQSDGPVPGQLGASPAANSLPHFLSHPPPPRFVPGQAQHANSGDSSSNRRWQKLGEKRAHPQISNSAKQRHHPRSTVSSVSERMGY